MSLPLFFLEDNVVSSRQFLPHLLISGGVKEEDASAQDPVEDGKGSVEGHILLILGEGADDEADEDQGHDDQVGPLHDLGTHQLGLINPRQSKKIKILSIGMIDQLKVEPNYFAWH